MKTRSFFSVQLHSKKLCQADRIKMINDYASAQTGLPEELPFPLGLSIWIVLLHSPAHSTHTHTHRHILMSSSKYNKLKKHMKSIHCRQGYLVSAWALSWVHSGWKSTVKNLVSLLCLSHSVTSTCLSTFFEPSHLLVEDSVSYSLVLLFSFLHRLALLLSQRVESRLCLRKVRRVNTLIGQRSMLIIEDTPQ